MTTSPTRDILLRARALIADRRRWTRDVTARDRHYRPVSATEPAAIQWCALGALLRVADDPAAFVRAVNLLEMAAAALFKRSVRWVNDRPGRTAHADLLAVFDHAIAAATEAERVQVCRSA
ncbi:MAG: hypothetical protein IT306_10170 [Chloroflexi bacterium]|nr:hypothetical protein [Chloroflexota bacterium]